MSMKYYDYEDEDEKVLTEQEISENLMYDELYDAMIKQRIQETVVKDTKAFKTPKLELFLEYMIHYFIVSKRKDFFEKIIFGDINDEQYGEYTKNMLDLFKNKMDMLARQVALKLYKNKQQFDLLQRAITFFVIVRNVRIKYLNDEGNIIPLWKKDELKRDDILTEDEFYEYIYNRIIHMTEYAAKDFLAGCRMELYNANNEPQMHRHYDPVTFEKKDNVIKKAKVPDLNNIEPPKGRGRQAINKKIYKYDANGELVAEYENRKECMETNKMTKQALYGVLSGKRKQYKGYIYKEES